LIWFDRSSKDLKRSLSSVNKPDKTCEDVDDAFDGLIFIIDVVDGDDDANEDEAEGWGFGIVLVGGCCWGGGGGKIGDGWWNISPAVVSFSSTKITRT
jgi:hypothetical protein